MRFLRLLFFLICLIACNSNKRSTKLKIAELKAQNKVRIGLIRISPEPLYEMVADSMKKWIPIFRNVLADDQKNRIVGYINYTPEEKNEQLSLDSQNLKIVSSYLDKYGWPVLYDIGLIGQRAIGLTIQHSPLAVQEKYYPYLVKAYKRDTLLYETLALLEDRINTKNHRFQYYGTQVVTFQGKQVLYPVFNVDSLEIYRKQLGFQITMKDYLGMLNAGWNVDEYKLILPQLIKELKVSDTIGIHYKKIAPGISRKVKHE